MTAPAQERLVQADPTAEESGPAPEPAAYMGDLATVPGRFMGVVLDRPTRELVRGASRSSPRPTIRPSRS